MDRKEYIGSATAYAIGAAIKIPSLLFAPFLFFRTKGIQNKVVFVSWFACMFILLSLPEIIVYHSTVIKNVFLYRGWSGWWGIGALVQKIAILIDNPQLYASISALHSLLMYGGILVSNIVSSIFVKSKLVGILLIILVASILSPSYASQYLIWPLPFILLLDETYFKEKVLYTILATFMAYNFYGVTFLLKWLVYLTQFVSNQTEFISYPMDTGIPVWIFMIFLLYKILADKRLKKSRWKIRWLLN
jgi:hypothetical protein